MSAFHPIASVLPRAPDVAGTPGERLKLTHRRSQPYRRNQSIGRHGRYVTFQLAEVAVPRNLFREILRRIDELRRRPAPA